MIKNVLQRLFKLFQNRSKIRNNYLCNIHIKELLKLKWFKFYRLFMRLFTLFKTIHQIAIKAGQYFLYSAPIISIFIFVLTFIFTFIFVLILICITFGSYFYLHFFSLCLILCRALISVHIEINNTKRIGKLNSAFYFLLQSTYSNKNIYINIDQIDC